MKIAVIAHNLHAGGGFTVGNSIISTLLQIAPEHEYLMLVPMSCGYVPAEAPARVKFIEAPCKPLTDRMIWERRHLNQLLTNFRPDWLWGLGNLAYPAVKCRQSILLHNPHRVYYHEGYRRSLSLSRRLIERYLDWKIGSDIKFVDRVYCQTQIMRDKVCERFDIPMEKTGLCPNAVKADFNQPTEIPVELGPYYKNKFIIFVPTRYYPAKNLEILVSTFAKHRDKLADTICVLLVSEDQGRGAANFIKRIKHEKLHKQLICLGSRPQEMMPQYYFAADAMLLPTELESFSGSYIEAMYFERPILTSKLDFAMELCENAALYFDQRDPDDVCRAILQVKDNEAMRGKMVLSGKKIISKMPSWMEIIGNVLDNEGISRK